MKKYLLTLIIAASCVCANAQMVNFGVKAGVNYTNPSYIDFSDWSSDGAIHKGVGFTGGLFVKVKMPVTGLFVEAEALYSKYKIKIDPFDQGANYSIRSEKWEFPVHVGFTFFKLLQVYAGPSFNYLSSSHINSGDVTLSDSRHGVSTAGDIGLRVLIKKFAIDARYQFPFSGEHSFVENMTDAIKFKSNPSMFTFTLAYSIL